MNVHKNARLTPSGRVLLVQRIEQGWSVERACEASGVPARTGYRWLHRYRSGDRQLLDRSSAPRYCPRRLADERIAAVAQLRRERQTGRAIARTLGMARSTVGLILRRLGLNRLALLEPKPPAPKHCDEVIKGDERNVMLQVYFLAPSTRRLTRNWRNKNAHF